MIVRILCGSLKVSITKTSSQKFFVAGKVHVLLYVPITNELSITGIVFKTFGCNLKSITYFGFQNKNLNMQVHKSENILCELYHYTFLLHSRAN